MAKAKVKPTTGLVGRHFSILSLKHRKMAIYRCTEELEDRIRVVNLRDAEDSKQVAKLVIGGTVKLVDDPEGV